MAKITDSQEFPIESLELDLLLEAIYRRYGYDFRKYARASLKRRVLRFVHDRKTTSISKFQGQVLHDPDLMKELLCAITVNVTSMFRDPEFFLQMRERLVPFIRTYPTIRIWCAGCSTGEEAYSLAIVLEEEGLLQRSRIYATDIDEAIVRKARDGAFPSDVMKEYEQNYQLSGGKRPFSQYFTMTRDTALINQELKTNIVFAPHNMATDASFNEFQVILCRNALIYFSKELQDRAHKVLFGSLCLLGILGLGNKESLRFSPHELDYRQFVPGQRLYQRVR